MDDLITRQTILIVDKDSTLRRIIGHVLVRDGHAVLEAADGSQALQLAERHRPRLAVLDLCLTDGNSPDLLGRLHAGSATVPLILITGYPLAEFDDLQLARPYVRVLTKPFDVDQLRAAVKSALSETVMEHHNPCPASAPPASTPPANRQPPAAAPPARPVAGSPARAGGPVQVPSKAARIKSGAIVVVALCVLAGFLLMVAGVPIPGIAGAGVEPKRVKQDAPPRVDLVDGRPNTVSVPEETRRLLGIRKGGVDQLATAATPSRARPLTMSGSTGLDPNRLFRFRIRFTPAECIEIGQVDEPGEGPTKQREVRSGDIVHKGQRLALFHSIDVGNMKSNLVDAILQLKLDQKILDASQTAYDKGALPYLDYMAAVRAVEGDYSLINRTENTLRAWYIPEEDIEAVRKEAEKIYEQGGKRDRNPEHIKEQVRRWARVELIVPEEFDGGVIVERNLSVKDVVVDNTLNLFQVANVKSLLVVANAPEDELETLHGLSTAERQWIIRPLGSSTDIRGPIDDISYIIDVNQHSAVVKGHIPNEGRLRSGQYATATVELPAPKDVVEIPTSGVADDGKQAVVFVQAGDKPGIYTMRRVEIVQRFDKTVFVRSKFAEGRHDRPLTPEDKEQGLLPRHVLTPGEKIITAGVLEIKRELDNRAVAAEAAKK
jgi:CheY-like chemotaxis protein/multidrug efflux pump subunit AcrA (membrane-fusion protein)